MLTNRSFRVMILPVSRIYIKDSERTQQIWETKISFPLPIISFIIIRAADSVRIVFAVEN